MAQQSDMKSPLIDNQYDNTYAATAPPSYNAQPPHAQQHIQYQPMPIQNQPYSSTTTSVVVTHQPAGRVWRSGICDCYKNCGVCMCVYCFQPCYTVGLAQRMGESCCVGMITPGMSALRTKFRMTHGIQGTVLEDACVSMFCSPCAACQLGNEMAAENYPTNGCAPC
ncbi:cornifelin homolog [Ciona intestinalis]